MRKFKDLSTLFLKNKILIENFSFLSILQITNLVLFLLTVPYLFRILGKETYGLVIFAQTVVLYFSILVNFGFNLTATRDISVNRLNKAKLDEIVSGVLTIKLIFFLLALLIMYLLTILIGNFRNYRFLYLFSMLASLSEALFPLWFFQGIEKMKYITFINIGARIISTILVFVLIRQSSDYIRYPLIIGAGSFSGAVAGLMIVFGRYRTMFRLPPLSDMITCIRENALYFFANVSTQVYVNANRLIVGAFLGMAPVAYYDVAEKVVNMIKVPFSVLNQAFFPKFAKERNFSFLRKLMYITILCTAIVICGLFIFSFPVVNLLTGSANQISVNILRILSISLLPIAFSIFYGDIALISFGLKKEYALMRFSGLLLYLALIGVLVSVKQIGLYQTGAAIVTVEFFIALYSYILCKRAHLT